MWLSDLIHRRKLGLMRRMVKMGGNEKQVMVALVSRGLTSVELHVPAIIREILPECVGSGYNGKWWINSLVEWLMEDPNTPLATVLRYKGLEVNPERIITLKWSGVVLQGEGVMTGDKGDWTRLGLEEYEEVVGEVKSGPLLLRIGQCWAERGDLCRRIFEILAIKIAVVDVRVWKSVNGEVIRESSIV